MLKQCLCNVKRQDALGAGIKKKVLTVISTTDPQNDFPSLNTLGIR